MYHRTTVAALMTALNLAMVDWWEAHVRKPPVACLERQDSLGINRGGIAARQADTMRNFKKDQLVQKADEELSEVVPDNLKVKCIPAARQP